MSPPDAVTLDLFGTLLDFDVRRDEAPLVADLLREADAPADPADVLETWIAASLAERGRTPFRTVRRSLAVGAREAAREHALDVDPLAWAERLEALWATRPLVDDAGPALDRLDAAPADWAIVTNLDAHVLAEVLERTGLGERAPAWVCSERARAYKPHPRPFRLALARLGARPSASVHVGNDPGEDRAGARAAGMRCVLVEEGLTAAVEAALER